METALENTVWDIMYCTGLNLAGISHERGTVVLSVRGRIVPRRDIDIHYHIILLVILDINCLGLKLYEVYKLTYFLLYF